LAAVRVLRVTLFLLWTCSAAFLCRGAELLHVSFDPTRELFKAYNHWFLSQNPSVQSTLKVRQSHSGSGKQARAILEGLDADVASLALAYDIDLLVKNRKLLPENWAQLYPHQSSPFYSTVLFLVRSGNRKNIRDWDDLVRPGVKVITPNPKTSGGARWNYLAAWGAFLRSSGGDHRAAQEKLRRLFLNVPVLDSGARGAATTFVQREIGDVLITWENEAFLALREFGTNRFEVVYPPRSILAEPPVVVVEKIARRKKNLEVARTYVKGMYDEEAQRIIARHNFRPRNAEVLREFESRFRAIELFGLQELYPNWAEAHATHFAEGALFDQLYYRGKE
jgi:sulfate transport system substrate-binding protein